MKKYFEERRIENRDEIIIVDEDGNIVSDAVFQMGDELVLLEMPFDKDGRHATGIADFAGYKILENGFWYPDWTPRYEGD